MEKNNFNKIAPLLVVCGAIVWGFQGIFVNWLCSFGFDSSQSATLRCITAGITMLVFMLIVRPKDLKINIKHLPLFLCAGILGTLLTSQFYFKSIMLNGLTVSSILIYVEPAILMVLSAILFKDKLTPLKLISLLLAFTGCVFVCGVGTDSEITTVGIIFGLLSALTYALYSVFCVFLFKLGYGSLTVITYAMVFAGIGSIFTSDLGEIAGILTGNNAIVYLSAFLTGFGTAVLPYGLYTTGLKGTKPSNAAIIAYIEPLTATVAGILIYSEKPTLLTFLGIFLIVFSVIILNVKRNSNQN